MGETDLLEQIENSKPFLVIQNDRGEKEFTLTNAT